VSFFPPGTGWLGVLAAGTLLTVELVSIALVMASVVGAIVGVGLTSRRHWVRLPARIYVEVFRSVPLILQMFFIYYGVAGLLDINLPAYGAGVIALGLYGGSYMSEVVRTGVQAIGAGQWEAAYSLGMTPIAALRRVVAPQALRIMAPPAVGVCIGVLKDSSVASIIGLLELTGSGLAIYDSNLGRGGFGVLAALGVIYLVMCYLLSQLGGAMERRWAV
jgi:His/Glu/Gln/Arg/opine family amino acid ABC transporter permease subunit